MDLVEISYIFSETYSRIGIGNAMAKDSSNELNGNFKAISSGFNLMNKDFNKISKGLRDSVDRTKNDIDSETVNFVKRRGISYKISPPSFNF
jgi:hypothetical protein